MGFRFKPKRERAPHEGEDVLVKVETYIPRSMFEKLRNYSNELEMPKSRLLAYALYNEMYESAEPFKFETKIPDTENVQDGQYLKEAELLVGLIRQFPKGAGIDMLIMAREMIRLSYDELLLAYRELVNLEQIVTVHPASANIPGIWRKNYFHALVKNKKEHEEEVAKKRSNRQPKPQTEGSPLSELNPQIKK